MRGSVTGSKAGNVRHVHCRKQRAKKVVGVLRLAVLTFAKRIKEVEDTLEEAKPTEEEQAECQDSEEERNKPFVCDICNTGFHFQSSLNSHKSKAHQETSGLTFRCPLCPSVTNSKNGMRRHLRNWPVRSTSISKRTLGRPEVNIRNGTSTV